MDANELSAMINDLEAELSSAGSGKTNWKEHWASIKVVGNAFRGVRYPTRDEHRGAWDRFQSIVERFKTRQAQHFESRRSTTDASRYQQEPGDLYAMIENLASNLSSAGTGRTNWKEHWASIKTVRDSFKGVRFSTRDAHQATWNRFQSIVENFKAKQESHFRERHSAGEASRYHLERVRSLSNFDYVSDLEILWDIFSGPSRMVGKIALDAIFGQSNEEKERLQQYSQTLKGAWNYFNSHKDDLRGDDRALAYASLNAAQERLNDMWAKWKDERQQISDKDRAAKKARSEEWRARQIERIERLEGSSRQAGRCATSKGRPH